MGQLVVLPHAALLWVVAAAFVRRYEEPHPPARRPGGTRLTAVGEGVRRVGSEACGSVHPDAV